MNDDKHPEQDPVEGSRRTIEKELERKKGDKQKPPKRPDITPEEEEPSEAG